MQKQTARLENWKSDGNMLYGDVYDHPRLSDGLYVHTSSIVKMADDQKSCETLNTIYTLGSKPANLEEKPDGCFIEDTGHKPYVALKNEIDALTLNKAKFEQIARTFALTIEQKDSQIAALIKLHDINEFALTAELVKLKAEVERLKKEIAKENAVFFSLKKDSDHLKGLRKLMGYVEAGDSTTVELYQDDATYSFFIKVGKRSYYADSFTQAIDAAMKENSK